MKAYDIQWDADGDNEALASLPNEIEVPDSLKTIDEISDYITDRTGFCHFGFRVDRIQELNL